MGRPDPALAAAVDLLQRALFDPGFAVAARMQTAPRGGVTLVFELRPASARRVKRSERSYARLQNRWEERTAAAELNPDGEYAMAALGRERMYEYYSQVLNLPIAILRLNYATELRYGVLIDIAAKVLSGEPVPLEMGYLNTVLFLSFEYLFLFSHSIFSLSFVRMFSYHSI